MAKEEVAVVEYEELRSENVGAEDMEELEEL